LQPGFGVQPLGGRTGEQGHFFRGAAFGLTQQPGRLRGKGKADVFGADDGGANDSVLLPALVLLLGAGLGGGGRLRGENPLGERGLSFAREPAAWAGFSWP
jgi:hypothetical protein